MDKYDYACMAGNCLCYLAMTCIAVEMDRCPLEGTFVFRAGSGMYPMNPAGEIGPSSCTPCDLRNAWCDSEFRRLGV